MNNDLLIDAKRRLPLRQLMGLLGHDAHAKKSARCPFHDDSAASFSVFPGNDGELRWKCFAGCGQGDAIDYLALARSLNNADACREFKRMAGVGDSATPARSASSGHGAPVNLQPPFSWLALVAAFSSDHAAKLAEWRGYPPGFVTWLHSEGLIGLHDGERIAFPVHAAEGDVVGCHYRRSEDGSWRYHPTGTKTRPLVVGTPQSVSSIWAFESQWDAFAVMARLGWHFDADSRDIAIVITRGAENGKLIAGLCATNATVYAFAQNDPPRENSKPTPAEKWLRDISAQCGCKCVRVVTPPEFKDPNDWTRAGVTAAVLDLAIREAQPVPCLDVDLRAGRSTRGHQTDRDDEALSPPAPFPTDALPAGIATIVRAVARSERVPEALPGVIALGILSASIGAGLEVQSSPHRTTRGNLFLLASAESGSGKSECFRLIAEPLLARQEQLCEHWRTTIGPKMQAEIRTLETQLKKLDRNIAKSQDPTELDRLKAEMEYKLARQAELKSQSTAPLLVAQDTTTERLAVLLQINDEVIFSTSPDARKLCDNLLGRYSANKMTDESLYLCGYSGDHVRVDRQGRDPVTLRKPCLSLLWLVQPDALDLLLNESSLSQSGFLPRCLITHTRAEPQRIDGDTEPLSEAVRTRWAGLVAALLNSYRFSSDQPNPLINHDEPL